VAIKREVFEETGIQTDFKCLISFRHGHNYFSDCSDIYMLAYLTPQNADINICKQEILECRWMTVKITFLITKLFSLPDHEIEKLEIQIMDLYMDLYIGFIHDFNKT